jgi:hypothetical protein
MPPNGLLKGFSIIKLYLKFDNKKELSINSYNKLKYFEIVSQINVSHSLLKSMEIMWEFPHIPKLYNF